MMKLVLERAINKPSIVFALSPQKDKLAAASARKIFLYSLPDLNLLKVIPLHHVHRILWLDNDIFYAVTVSGYVSVFSPEREKMERVGQWSKSYWSELDIFFCGKDKFVSSYFCHGICAFDLANHSSRSIYHDKKYVFKIAGVKDELFYGIMTKQVTLPFQRSFQKAFAFIGDSSGKTFKTTPVSQKMKGSFAPIRLLDNGNIACTYAKRVPGSCVKRPYLFLVDPVTGNISELGQIPSKDDEISTFAISPEQYYAFAFAFFEGNALICRKGNLSDCVLIDTHDRCTEKEDNGITTVAFLSDEHILVGTWNETLLFRIIND